MRILANYRHCCSITCKSYLLVKGLPDLTMLHLYTVLTLEDEQLVDCQDDERQFIVDFEVIGTVIIILVLP